MPEETYLAEIAEYYNHSRVPAEPGAAVGFRKDAGRPLSWAYPIVAEMQSLFEGKRVLEAACGMGRWTQIAADVAAHVVATDVSPNLLENARGLPFPKGNVAFLQSDAFDIQQIAGPFDAGLHMNFINHLPLPLVPRFLDGFHAALGSGAMVFCGAQRFRGDAKDPCYETHEGDTVSLRHHDDGRPVEVVDTLFTEDLLRGLLAGRGTHLHVSMNKWWWWTHYQVA